ncbi:MAG: AsmA family protein [Rickettsiales bacterium]|jgi:hypothetical protein|nr:AsmA family protein [Rickettsiales bacterium]
MKKIVLIVPGMAVLSYFVFLTIVKNQLNAPEIKSRINSALSEEIAGYKENYFLQNKNIRFSIDGRIDLSIFPSARLRIDNVNMSAIQYRDYSLNANIRRIEIRLGLMGLLRKKFNIIDTSISGIEFTMLRDPLKDSYVKQEVIKKQIKLEENEVIGLKDRLKTIFTGNSDVKDGYREVEVVEDRVINVDNSRTRLMFLNLMETVKVGGASFGKSSVNFSGANITFISDGAIRKEIHNVSGKISLSRNKKFEASFVLNNVAGNVAFQLSGDGDNQKFEVKLSSELLDEINIEYRGNNIFIEDFANLVANYKLAVKTTGFNNLLQWILFNNSEFQYYVDYKKSVQFTVDAEQNKSSYKVKNFTINSEDLSAKGSFSHIKDWNELEVEVGNLNLNGITINILKTKAVVDQDKISIFKVKGSDELFKIIRDKKVNSSVDSAVKINIKNMIKDNMTLTDSLLDFEVINSSYKINNFTLNLNDMGVRIENQREVDGFFISDLTMTGKNFNSITNFFNIPNTLGLKEFELKSGVFIYNGTVYITDYELGDKNVKIGGSVEYSVGGSDSYLAYVADLDEFSLNVGDSKVTTMKEKFLWLNNFTKNIFAELHIKKLKYNEKLSITDIVTRVNYSPGFINLYNIENMNFGFAEGVSGRILLDIRGKSPTVGIDLRIGKINLAGDLINYVFDIEKYKNIILKEPINVENRSKYWINRLFSIPAFDEIGGKINIIVGNIKVNGAQLSALSVSASLDEGVFALNNFKFSGLGGTTELRGLVDLKSSKVVNLVLTETTYNIEEIAKLFMNDAASADLGSNFKGTLGLGGLLKGAGPSEVVFDAALDMQFKFVGKALFIKNIGLDDLRKRLSKVYLDRSLLNMNIREILFNGSGTVFNDFSGLFTVRGGISNLTMDAKGEGTSTRLMLKVDNRSDTKIDAINTSVIMNRVGKKDIPLYLIIKFTENFAQKAQLEINTEQIDKYLDEIRKLSN